MRPIHGITGIAAVALVCSSTLVMAACEDALVMSTYRITSATSVDWRLTDLVDRGSYEQIKREAGVSAVIYGVPVGASYDEFRSKVDRYKRETQQSLSRHELLNIAYTGLDPNSSSVYRACLDAQVFRDTGLHAAVVGATESDIVILVKWFVPGEATAATVDWSPATIMGVPLDRTIYQGLRSIRVSRPGKQMSLVGNYLGYSTERLILEPYEKPVPRPKLKEWVRVAGNQITSVGGNLDRTVCAHPLSGFKFLPATASIAVTRNEVDDHGVNWSIAEFPKGRTPTEQEVCVYTQVRPSSSGQRATIEAWADIQQVEE